MRTAFRQSALFRLLVALALGLALGNAIKTWLLPGLGQQSGDAPRVEILVNGRDVLGGGGSLALPRDTTFMVRVIAPGKGRIELLNINPLGLPAGQPIWTAAADGAGALTSPALRLVDPPGTDTLVVVFKPSLPGLGWQRTVQVWHP